MNEVAVIGLDLAKDVFQLHGVDKDGAVVLKKRLRRADVLTFFEALKPCLVAMEACGTAHHWGREIAKFGHRVKLMSAALVKPYVKSQKNDPADAEAICEAVQRPNMRFVTVKSRDQQAILVVHRVRDLLNRQQVMLVNACRSQLAEFGIVAARGRSEFASLVSATSKIGRKSLPPAALKAIRALIAQWREKKLQVAALERELRLWHRQNANSQRLATMPGIGVITATALAASISDPREFRSGRHMAVWLGLVPRQFSSGGKISLGRITKRGNTRLRTLLVFGARTALAPAKRGGKVLYPGAEALLARKPRLVAAVALANKMARIAWALLVKQENFAPHTT
jgi:transposase